ncbi:MAG: ATP-binding protein [Vicinamibacterales bacterium]
MPLLASLSNRIFLACTLVATTALGIVLYVVNARVSAETEVELQRGLAEAAGLVDERRVTLTDTFTRLATLVADLPKLKAAVATADPPTVQPLADDYRVQTNAGVLVVTGSRGQVLGSAGADEAALEAAVSLSGDPGAGPRFAPHSRGLLQLVSVPIVIDPAEQLGRLTLGFFLDDRLAAQFRDLTGSHIAFAWGARVLASTLPSAGTALGTLTPGSPIAVDGETFVADRRPMTAAGSADGPATLVLRSRTERLRNLNAIQTALVGVLVVTLLVATAVSYGVARTVARPLRAITSRMREIAATGDLTQKITLGGNGWDDEDARLVATTFNTLTDSVARFQAQAAQRDRLASLGRLSTVVAHEVRNPLMIIRAALNTLRQERATPEDIREAVTDIDEETARLNRIVGEVLDFAKPLRFDFTETALNDVCRDSAAAATAGDPEPGIVLALDPADPRMTTDPERLRTALINVLTNARHAVLAGRDGRDTATDAITLTTAAPGDGRVRVTVTDRGAGIAPEHLAAIFEPYFTTRRAGTGLGLPIARNIIEGLGGRIGVASTPGRGTRIEIDLPVSPREARA